MRSARMPGGVLWWREPGPRDGSRRRGALRCGRSWGCAGEEGGGTIRAVYGHGAHKPHQRPRSGDVCDGRRRHTFVVVGAADDAGDASLIAFHQAGSPASPAPRPTGRPRRPGWSRGMGTHQPVDDPDLIRLLKQAASELGAKAWIVGGYVRDSLLGRAHPDLDVVVEEGRALELADRFARLAGAAAPVIFERFGTAQVTVGAHLVEFVSARAESYKPDSRKPV